MRNIKQIKNLKGKTVLLRVDYNVPFKKGIIEDDFRIKKSFATIEYLIKKNVDKIVIITHLGKDGSASLSPIKKHFFKISKYSPEKIIFFENVRKFLGEIKNDIKFAQKLAELGDIYVNDAFSVSHREHSSVVLLPKLMPSYAGLQLEEEVSNLSHAFKKPKHPFLFILGGAKFSTKMPLIKKYIKLADYIFIGGALANDFLKAKGYEVGKSLVDDIDYGIKNILNNKKLIIPTDVIVKSKDKLILKNVEDVEKNDVILDIGKKTSEDLMSLIKNAKLILWNGPLGKYEKDGEEATNKILKVIFNQKNKNIILGGGDLVSCIPMSNPKTKSYKLKASIFVSTGGGATIDFLVNGTLPGIKALHR